MAVSDLIAGGNDRGRLRRGHGLPDVIKYLVKTACRPMAGSDPGTAYVRGAALRHLQIMTSTALFSISWVAHGTSGPGGRRPREGHPNSRRGEKRWAG